MKVLYISSMVDGDTYSKLFVKDKKPMIAASKFNTLICEGLAKNGIEVTSCSALPVNKENCDKKWIKAKNKKLNGYVQKYPSFFNFSILRHVKFFLYGFFKALFSPKSTVVLYDALVVSFAYGAVLGAKLLGKKRVAIITDLPQCLDSSEKRNKVFYNMLSKSSGYIILTKQMNEVVNPKNKPYVVIEGVVDSNMNAFVHTPFSECKKIVTYAGTLLKKYGIKNLCEAFINVCKDDEELHIYGDGDYVLELEELIKKHKNVKYFGNRPNNEVVLKELNSVLLVNPRPNVGEYVKYSFPSKTLEYMVSGTPVLTAKLDGIPDEYNEFLYFFDSLSEDGLKVKLREILDKTLEELAEFGEKAKEFSLSSKNNKNQAEIIIEFIKSL